MLMRGANPSGQTTTYGIYGGVYARDNYIHGDDANPAANNVEQVGIYMIGPDNSTQTRNTFERLDKGIEVGVDARDLTELDISGNMFRDVVQGISFFTYYTRAMVASRLHVRCNSFENPANLTGAVALNTEGPDFPSALGDAANGNGNRFVTPGLPGIEPISNNLGLILDYWRFGASTQESFSQASANQTYQVKFTGGNPATACTDAGYVNGINNRNAAGSPTVGTTELQQAADSLRMAIPAKRQQALLATLIAATIQRQGYVSLENYLAGLPGVAQAVHAALGGWLLHYYREEAHDEPGAQRVRTALLTRHPADPEVSNSVRLSDALTHLAQRAHPLSPPAPAALAALREVAASGTAAARVACRVARRYEPACPCRLAATATASAQAIAQREAAPTSRVADLGAPYPNPASATIHFPYVLTTGGGAANLEIRNALGQVVRQVELTAPVGEVQLSVHNLPAGLYSCTLRGAGLRYVVRRFAVTN